MTLLKENIMNSGLCQHLLELTSGSCRFQSSRFPLIVTREHKFCIPSHDFGFEFSHIGAILVLVIFNMWLPVAYLSAPFPSRWLGKDARLGVEHLPPPSACPGSSVWVSHSLCGFGFWSLSFPVCAFWSL